jgi:hypothetical protein
MKNFLRKTFRNKKSKKEVSFKSKPTVHEIPHTKQSEVDDIWYRSQDAHFLLRESKEIYEMSESEVPLAKLEQFGYCTRGLEGKVRENMYRTTRRRHDAWKVVFAAQHMQMKSVLCSPESLATIYGSFCKAAVEDALEMAKLDEKYVREQREPKSSLSGLEAGIDSWLELELEETARVEEEQGSEARKEEGLPEESVPLSSIQSKKEPGKSILARKNNVPPLPVSAKPSRTTVFNKDSAMINRTRMISV